MKGLGSGDANNSAKTEGIRPRQAAIVALELWLNEIAVKDEIRAAVFINELMDAIPDFAEWIKKRAGHHHQVAVPEPKT